jgi:hypothetical protein
MGLREVLPSSFNWVNKGDSFIFNLMKMEISTKTMDNKKG